MALLGQRMRVKVNEVSSKLCCVDSWGFYNYAVGFFKSHSLKIFFWKYS